jgi:hypothetical protein
LVTSTYQYLETFQPCLGMFASRESRNHLVMLSLLFCPSIVLFLPSVRHFNL